MIKVKAEGKQGSGKSTLLYNIKRYLTEKGISCEYIEGDGFERLEVSSEDVLNRFGGYDD